MSNPWMTRTGGHPIEDFEPVSLQLAGWGHRERAQLAYDLREEERQRRGAATPDDTDADDKDRDASLADPQAGSGRGAQ